MIFIRTYTSKIFLTIIKVRINLTKNCDDTWNYTVLSDEETTPVKITLSKRRIWTRGQISRIYFYYSQYHQQVVLDIFIHDRGYSKTPKGDMAEIVNLRPWQATGFTT
jgi:hypothetical protein